MRMNEKCPTDTKTDVDKLWQLVKVQVDDPSSKTDPYMRGMANGLICALAVFKKWEPIYIEAPKESSDQKDAEIQRLKSLGCHCGESRRLAMTAKELQSKLDRAVERLKESDAFIKILGRNNKSESIDKCLANNEEALAEIEGSR